MRIKQMTILAAIMLGAASPALSQTAAETETAAAAAAASDQLHTAMPAFDHPDQREIIYLSAERRYHIFQEMQAFLLATQDIIIAIGENDMQAVQEAASKHRTGYGYDALGMRDSVPEAFYAMAQDTRDGFARVAEAAKTGSTQKVAEELGETMTNCDVCHATWQMREKN